MQKILKAIFVTFLFLCGVGVSAQSIKGKVLDSEGQPLVGATVWWAATTVGSVSDMEGNFSLHRVQGYDKLVATFAGYHNDTVIVNKNNIVNFTLEARAVEVDGVVVHGSLRGNYIKTTGIVKDEVISFAGICKMACCNLAESFENSAAVTVGYSDAISGARQIKMLGLAGIYTQILDESRPIMRGIGSPYGLSYTPGMWLNSIGVSKGVSSVTAGHEAITGQINLEYRKPTDLERLFVNVYLNNELRPELNLSSALPVSKDGKLSTVIMLHASADTDVNTHDNNDDGYRDTPKTSQLNFANRWLYTADNGLQVRWGYKLLQEKRLGGDIHYTKDMRPTMYEDNIYGSEILNRGANGYLKLGMPVGRGIYDEESDSEIRSSIAFVADYDYFDEDAYFGLNTYNGEENSVTMNLSYNHYFSPKSYLAVGASAYLQNINEKVVNSTPWLLTTQSFDLSRRENEVGLYGEYNYSPSEKFSLVVGLRGDYNDSFNKFFFTPRSHIRWAVTPSTVLRVSAGLGSRTSNTITDNIGILATGRTIIFDDGIGSVFDSQERAATYGGSITQSLTLLRDNDFTISFDYFRSDFSNQVIVDQEMTSTEIHIYNSTEGVRSYTDTYQADLMWSPIEGFDIFATYRYTSSLVTLTRASGEKVEVERPLVSKFKTLLNLQYATKYRKWVFDATAQLNGPMRLPTQTGSLDDSSYSPSYPVFFAQVSHRIRSVELYAGCENIANYTQDDAILSPENPYSSDFNSSVVWGPLMGRKFYIGLRYNLY